MTRRSNLPRQLPPLFAYRDALDRGVAPGRLRASDLDSPYRGVRSVRSLENSHDRAHAYQVRMLPGQFFSHLTAAELLGLRLPETFAPDSLHVTSLAPMRAPRCAGVIGHQAECAWTRPHLGLALTTPLQTWLDCSRYLGVDDLIVMGDGLVRRKSPSATIEQLVSAVRSRRGRAGSSRLARALEEIRPNTDSPRESLLRLLLCRAGYPEPEPNGEIADASGSVIAHGDLVYRRHKLVVEYDGGQHRKDEAQFEIDIERLDAIRRQGWRVERVGKSLMRRQGALLAKVEAALVLGGWHRGA